MSADPHVNVDSMTKTYYTIATLPAASTMQGERLWVSDCSVSPISNFGATASGGGTFRGIVQSDGTAWKYASSRAL